MRTIATLTIAFSLLAAGPALADDSYVSNALSGMNSSARAIDQASTNIANANTTGVVKSGFSAADAKANRSASKQSKPAGGGHRR